MTDAFSFVECLTDEGEEVKKLILPELAKENIEFGGFYVDEELTIEFDFLKPIENGTTVYSKLK